LNPYEIRDIVSTVPFFGAYIVKNLPPSVKESSLMNPITALTATVSRTLTDSAHRSFWALWSATALSNLADGVFKLALPLLALRITNSPAVVAGVALAVRLPWLFFALTAGGIADRLDRRLMMIGANLFRVLILAGVVIMVQMGHVSVPLLYGAALLLGIAETLADTAGAAVIPIVVEPKDYDRANAGLVGVMTVTNEFIGPPLGGALAAIGLALAFGTSAGLYLVAAGALIVMVGSFQPMRTSQAPFLSEMWEGLRFVWQNRMLRTLAIIVAVMNLAWSAWSTVMVLYLIAPGPGNLTEFEFGLMLTSIGIGGVLGAVVAEPFARRAGRHWAVMADIVGTFLMMSIPIFTVNAWWIGGAAVLGGIGGSMWGVVVSSMRQQATPEALQGRVSGVFRLFGYGALSVGAALAGVIAEYSSIPMVFVVVAVMNALLVIPFFRDIYPRTGNAK
jgi:MFS family permease